MPPRKTEVALLELSPTQFQALSDAKATALLAAQTDLNVIRGKHARLGLVAGLATYAISISGCVILGLHGDYKLAAGCLGTPVLTLIRRFIESRL